MLKDQFILGLAEELVVDLFAGGGGASTGIEQAIGRHVDIAVNHDPAAVSMHEANHPQTRHFVSDVFEVDPVTVTGGQPVGLLWASPDCKHFSKAKGGKPVSKKIRGLAWVVVEWARAVRPRVICLENVEEFKTWGPLDANDMPCPIRKGETFLEWKGALEALGYVVEYRELRACDYGAPTIRKRLFLVARCDGQPIVWPSPTHGPGLRPHRTAAECIDWSLPCPSIFERERPLAEATMRRIAHGIKRYVLDTAKPYIVRIGHTGHGDGGKTRSVEEPLSTVTSKAEHLLASPTLVKHFGGEPQPGRTSTDVRHPAPTVLAQGGKQALVAAFLAKHYGGHETPGVAVDGPISTITTQDHHHLVSAHVTKFRVGSVGSDLGDPLHTVTAGGEQARPGTGNAMGIVTAHMVGLAHGDHAERPGSRSTSMEDPVRTIHAGGGNHALVSAQLVGCGGRAGQSRPRSADEPTQTITAKGDTALVASTIVKNNFGTNPAQATDTPLHTVTTQWNKHAEVRALLLKYYGTDQDPELREPLHTVTTKDRFGLVTVKGVDYFIADIGMRMLQPRELYRAQGFPDSYIIDRGADGRTLTKAEQVRMCGNSVCPPLARAIVLANYVDSSMLQEAA